jgi:2'-5' RNA ligase
MSSYPDNSGYGPAPWPFGPKSEDQVPLPAIPPPPLPVPQAVAQAAAPRPVAPVRSARPTTQDLQDFTVQESLKRGIDPALTLAMFENESHFNPRAQGPVRHGERAQGPGQVMPSTAAKVAPTYGQDPRKVLTNPYDNIEFGINYLGEHLDKYGDVESALRAYNAGPHHIQESHGYRETNNYVANINAARERYAQDVLPLLSTNPQQTQGPSTPPVPQADAQSTRIQPSAQPAVGQAGQAAAPAESEEMRYVLGQRAAEQAPQTPPRGDLLPFTPPGPAPVPTEYQQEYQQRAEAEAQAARAKQAAMGLPAAQPAQPPVQPQPPRHLHQAPPGGELVAPTNPDELTWKGTLLVDKQGRAVSNQQKVGDAIRYFQGQLDYAKRDDVTDDQRAKAVAEAKAVGHKLANIGYEYGEDAGLPYLKPRPGQFYPGSAAAATEKRPLTEDELKTARERGPKASVDVQAGAPMSEEDLHQQWADARKAGDIDSSVAVAANYLDQFPKGKYATVMRADAMKYAPETRTDVSPMGAAATFRISEIEEMRKAGVKDETILRRIEDDVARQMHISPTEVAQLTERYGQHPFANIAEPGGAKSSVDSILRQGRSNLKATKTGVAEFTVEQGTLNRVMTDLGRDVESQKKRPEHNIPGYGPHEFLQNVARDPQTNAETVGVAKLLLAHPEAEQAVISASKGLARTGARMAQTQRNLVEYLEHPEKRTDEFFADLLTGGTLTKRGALTPMPHSELGEKLKQAGAGDDKFIGKMVEHVTGLLPYITLIEAGGVPALAGAGYFEAAEEGPGKAATRAALSAGPSVALKGAGPLWNKFGEFIKGKFQPTEEMTALAEQLGAKAEGLSGKIQKALRLAEDSGATAGERAAAVRAASGLSEAAQAANKELLAQTNKILSRELTAKVAGMTAEAAGRMASFMTTSVALNYIADGKKPTVEDLLLSALTLAAFEGVPILRGVAGLPGEMAAARAGMPKPTAVPPRGLLTGETELTPRPAASGEEPPEDQLASLKAGERQAAVFPKGVDAPSTNSLKKTGLIKTETPLGTIVHPKEIASSEIRKAYKENRLDDYLLPQPKAAEQPPVPESKATLDTQLEALRAGTRPAVLFTKGERFDRAGLEKEGFSVTPTSVGTFVHKPEITREQINQSVEDNSYGKKFLSLVTPKPAAGEPAATVVARAPEGHEAQAAVVPPEHVEPQKAAFKEAYPASTVGVEPPERVVAERISQARSRKTYESLKTGPPQDAVYLQADATNSPSDLIVERPATFNEVSNNQGTFVLLKSSEDTGVIYPNPTLRYRPRALRAVFPRLSEDEFESGGFEPVRVHRTPSGWEAEKVQVEPPEKVLGERLAVQPPSGVPATGEAGGTGAVPATGAALPAEGVPPALNEDDIRQRVTKNWGGPEGLHQQYTAEGLMRVLGLPEAQHDDALPALLKSGLIEKEGPHYVFTPELRGTYKRAGEPTLGQTKAVVGRAEKQLKSDPDALVAAYSAEFGPGPRNTRGYGINLTDARKVLAPEARRPEGMAAVGEDLTEAAQALTERVYYHALDDPKVTHAIFPIAGAGGGKTTATYPEVSRRENVVYETHGEDPQELVTMIQTALDKGKTVAVTGIIRGPEDAMRAMIDRYKGAIGDQEGKAVAVGRAAETHVSAPAAYNALKEHFGDNPNVQFSTIDNTAQGGPAKRGPDKMPERDWDQTHEAMSAVLDKAHAEGTLTSDEYKQFGGRGSAVRAPERRPSEREEAIPQAKAEAAQERGERGKAGEERKVERRKPENEALRQRLADIQSKSLEGGLTPEEVALAKEHGVTIPEQKPGRFKPEPKKAIDLAALDEQARQGIAKRAEAAEAEGRAGEPGEGLVPEGAKFVADLGDKIRVKYPDGHYDEIAKPAGDAVPAAKEAPRRFVHQQFGPVEEAQSQAGVPKGHLRVTDEGGIEHIVQKHFDNQHLVLDKPDTYKFSSTQLNLPAGMAEKVREMGRKIPAEDLYGDGRETDPHVTLKYGLHDQDPEPVRSLLAGQGPITITLGKTSVFPDSGDGDVVKIDVESPQLHKLNKQVADNVPNTETHAEYSPHVTVAFVAPGKGEQYAGDATLAGQKVTLDHVEFSSADGQKTVIPLEGGKGEQARVRGVEGEGAKRSGPATDGGRAKVRGPEAPAAVSGVEGHKPEPARAGVSGERIPAKEVQPTAKGARPEGQDVQRGATVRRQAEAGLVQTKTEPITDAKSLAAAFKREAPSVSAAEAQVAAELLDHYVSEWAKDTGGDKAEWYRTRIAGVEAGGEAGPGALEQAPDTAAFKRWFADSKVVDEQGEPLVVYHATGSLDFETFKRRRNDIGVHFGTAGQADARMGFKFGKELPAGARTYPVYLSLQNPLRLHDYGEWNAGKVAFNLERNAGFSRKELQAATADNPLTHLKNLRNLIESKGHDGIVYRNQGESELIDEKLKALAEQMHQARVALDAVLPGDKRITQRHIETVPEARAYQTAVTAYEEYQQTSGSDSYIAFHPGQVKSATGNRGTFDPASPNILEQREPDVTIKVDAPALTEAERSRLSHLEQVTGFSRFSSPAPSVRGVTEPTLQDRVALGDESLAKELEDSKKERDALRSKADAYHKARQAAMLEKWQRARDEGKITYLRFGKPPASGKSRNHRDDIEEAGISAYEAIDHGDNAFEVHPSAPFAIGLASGTTQRDIYWLDGEEIGRGSDGEPLIKPAGAAKKLKSYSLHSPFSGWTHSPDRLEQGAKAAVEFLNDGRAKIRLYEKADVSSFAHEAAHIMRRDLERRISDLRVGGGTERADELRGLLDSAGEWAGVGEKGWEREHEEKFARGFEKYLHSGEAPTPELQSLFDKFKEWLRSIYQAIKGSSIDLDISAKMRSVYDSLLGGKGVDSDAKFTKWFRDSKVVDKEGRPLTVYHGTDAPPFEVFNTQVSTSNDGPSGAYFSPDRVYAGAFGEKTAPYYLSIKHPLDADAETNVPDSFWPAIQAELGVFHYKGKTIDADTFDTLGDAVEWLTSLERPDSARIRQTATQVLQELGYDGMVRLSGDEWIAFEPGQIKKGGEEQPPPAETAVGEGGAGEAATEAPLKELVTRKEDEFGKYEVYGDGAIDTTGNWKRFDRLPDDTRLVFWHATSRKAADSILAEGYHAQESAYTNTPPDYVYMGGKEGLGTYLGQQGKGDPVMVGFEVAKRDVEPDAGTDWKSHAKQPGNREFIARHHGKDAIKSPSATVTLANINQVRAHRSDATPIGILDPEGNILTSPSNWTFKPKEDALVQTNEPEAERLTTDEYDRTVEKYKALKEQGVSVDDYLKQGGLFGAELNPKQQELLKSLDAGKKRSKTEGQQAALLETAPTVESRAESKAGQKAIVGGPLFPGAGTALYQGAESRLVQTKTPEFKRWFGDSKVVDEKGEPLVVYHGTQAGDIQEFNRKLGVKLGFWSNDFTGPLGTWFSADPKVAGEFAVPRVQRAGEFASAIYPSYVSLQNPAVFDEYSDLTAAVNKAGSAQKLRRQLEREGNDGIIIQRSRTDFHPERKDVVAFEPTQIKSATGNRGAFDPNNPNILYQEAEKPLSVAATEYVGSMSPKELERAAKAQYMSQPYRDYAASRLKELGVTAQEAEPEPTELETVGKIHSYEDDFEDEIEAGLRELNASEMTEEDFNDQETINGLLDNDPKWIQSYREIVSRDTEPSDTAVRRFRELSTTAGLSDTAVDGLINEGIEARAGGQPATGARQAGPAAGAVPAGEQLPGLPETEGGQKAKPISEPLFVASITPELKAGASKINEGSFFNFKYAQFSSPEVEQAVRNTIKNAAVERGAAAKARDTLEAVAHRAEAIDPELVAEVTKNWKRGEPVPTTEVYNAMVNLADGMLDRAVTLRSMVFDGVDTDGFPLDDNEVATLNGEAGKLEHDAQEIHGTALGIRSQKGRELATMKSEKIADAKYFMARHQRLAAATGDDLNSVRFKALQTEVAVQANKLKAAYQKIGAAKRYIDDLERGKERSAAPAKVREKWQDAFLKTMDAQEQEARARVAKLLGRPEIEKRPEVLYQEEEPDVSSDLAIIFASKLARAKGEGALDKLREEMATEFGDSYVNNQKTIETTAFETEASGRREARLAAMRNPDQAETARQELAKELKAAQRAEKATNDAYEKAKRDAVDREAREKLQAARQAEAENLRKLATEARAKMQTAEAAARESEAAWGKAATGKVRDQARAEADELNKLAEQSKTDYATAKERAKQARMELASEAKDAAQTQKQIDADQVRELAEKARERVKQARKDVTEGDKLHQQAVAQAKREQTKQETAARKWNAGLLNNADLARIRLQDLEHLADKQGIADMAAVLAGMRSQGSEPAVIAAHMRKYGNSYTDNVQDIKVQAAKLYDDAKKAFKEAELARRATTPKTVKGEPKPESQAGALTENQLAEQKQKYQEGLREALEARRALAAIFSNLEMSKAQKVSTVLKAGLLWAPHTFAKVAGSHISYLLAEEAARIPGSLVDMMLSAISGNDRQLQGASLSAMNYARQMALGRGRHEAGDIWRFGFITAPADDLYARLGTAPSPLDLREFHTGVAPLDWYVNKVSRSHGAMYHVLSMYALARNHFELAELGARAEADKLIAKGKLEQGERKNYIARRRAELLQHPTPTMMGLAIARAAEDTFIAQTKLGEVLRGVLRGGTTLPPTASPLARGGQETWRFLADRVVPFPRVPVNVGLMVGKYETGIPAAVIEATYRWAKHELPPEAQRRISHSAGRGAIGWSLSGGLFGLLGLGALLAKWGLATGYGGDYDKQGRVKIGGRWYQIGGFAPIGNLITLGASLYEVGQGRYTGTGKAGAAIGVGHALIESMKEMPYIAGVERVTEAYDALTGKGDWTRVLGGFAGQLIPSAISDASAEFDPYERVKRSVWDYVKARTPARRSLEPKLGPDYKPVQETHRLLDPFQSRSASEPVMQTTPAEELASEMMRQRASEYLKPDEAKVEESYQKKRIIAALRDNGFNTDALPNDLREEYKKLSDQQRESVKTRAKETNLQWTFSHLPLPQAVKVWNLARDDEKGKLAPEFRQKIETAKEKGPLPDDLKASVGAIEASLKGGGGQSASTGR